jgi:hypothetical protein
VSSSYANTITVTQTGVGSGTIGGAPFNGAAFTITEIADTSDVTSFLGGFDVADTSASIWISGVGMLDFTVPTYTFVNQTNAVVGVGGPCCDLYDGPVNAAFSTWNMLSSIGPISGTADLIQWTANSVDTSGGILVFDNGPSDTVFTATVGTVPEPASGALLLTALLAIGVIFAKRL